MSKYIKSILFAFLATGIIIFSVPSIALAALTQAQIQAVIGLLQAFGADALTISNVQTALSGGTPATPTTAWCHTFNINLGYANSGTNEVANLHTLLQKEGISYGADGTNIYGENTMTAVIRLQAKYGIAQTGYFGSATRTKINSLYRCGTVTVCTPNWTCGWGTCANGYQSQIAVDSNNCGLAVSTANIACPALARTCTTSIQPATHSACNTNQQCVSIQGAGVNTCATNADCVISTQPSITSVTCTELITGYNDSSANKINLIFVGYGYENSPGSIRDVSYDMIMGQQGFFSIEPYKTNKSKFNLWYINQSGSLSNDCTLNGNYSCNDSLLIKGCPVNNVYKVHLVNSLNGYSTGGNPIVIQSADSMCNSLCRARTFIHEFSHSFANLLDEYSGDPSEFPSILTDSTKNCYAGPDHTQQECLLQAPWKNLIGNGCGIDGVIDCTENDPNYNKEIGCYEGCNHFGSGIFRPTRGSYMVDGLRYPYFGLWNEKLIQDKFNNIVPPPSAPSNLVAVKSVNSSSQTDITWTDNSNNEIGFEIERSANPTGPFTQISTMNSNTTSWTDAGLMSATTYYYRVKAYNSGGDSTYSNIAFATTTPSTQSSIQSSITVLSPNGGERWLQGSTQNISWSSTNLPTIMVDLIRPNYECHLTNGYIANTGSLTTTFSNCVNGILIPPANDYKVRVMYTSNTGIITQDESDGYFSIVAPATGN